MHVIKTWHFFLFVVLSALLSTSLTFGGWMYVQHLNTPLVVADKESEQCLQVLNFANGDAYNCDDVGVVLRRYRKTYDMPEAVPQPPKNAAVPPASAPGVPAVAAPEEKKPTKK